MPATRPDRGTGPPDVGVLLVNWNTRDLLGACLDSLDAAEDAGRFEIVVVDNGSTDGSADALAARARPPLVIRNAHNRGFTAATNQAAAAVHPGARYLLMLNSDTVVDPAAVARARDHLDAHPEVGAVGGSIRFPDGRPQGSCFRFPGVWTTWLAQTWIPRLLPSNPWLNPERYGNQVFDRPTDVDCCMGSFLMVRRAAVASDDGTLLDPGYWMYGEEADLCRRLRARGLAVRFVPEATLTHAHMGSVRGRPGVVAWKFACVRRAHLRFVHLWRGGLAAWSANLAMLLGLVPRALVWALADLRSGRLDRLLRARVAAFHLVVLVRPAAALRPWGPPPPQPPREPTSGAA